MKSHVAKQESQKSTRESSKVSEGSNGKESGGHFVDNRPEALQLRRMQEGANNSSQVQQFKALQRGVNLQRVETGAAQVTPRTNTVPVMQRNGQDGDSPSASSPSASSSFESLYDNSLTGLAAALIGDLGGVQNLDDDYLVGILENTFDSNWFKMKSCLTTHNWPGIEVGSQPDHAAGISLMTAMVAMRGRVWDEFVKRVQPGIVAEVESFKARHQDVADVVDNEDEDLNNNFKLKEAAGSESVTSDIDLSAGGENTEIGLAMLNREFKKENGVEPGAMYDINVYASDWMFNIKVSDPSRDDGGTLKQSISSDSEAKASTESELDNQNQKRKDNSQEIWSMVKIRRNMTEDDWSTYKAQMLESISGSGAEGQKSDMRRKFGKVDKEYQEFRETVEREKKKLEDALTDEEKQAEQNSPFAENGKDHFADEAREMEASNRQYEKIMEKVKVLRLKVQQLKDRSNTRNQVEELLIQISYNVSKGLTYANEVYATEGAVRHTVVGIQIGGKKLKSLQEQQSQDSSITGVSVDTEISKELYLQSVNENVGDTLHSLNHNKKDPQYAVFRAGKYIDRLCQAVVGLVSKDAAQGISGYKELRLIGDKAVQEKAGKAGQDPGEVHKNDSYFHGFDSGYLSVVKSQAMGLGAKAAALYKSS